jgi:hypothetical protein
MASMKMNCCICYDNSNSHSHHVLVTLLNRRKAILTRTCRRVCRTRSQLQKDLSVPRRCDAIDRCGRIPHKDGIDDSVGTMKPIWTLNGRWEASMSIRSLDIFERVDSGVGLLWLKVFRRWLATQDGLQRREGR